MANQASIALEFPYTKDCFLLETQIGLIKNKIEYYASRLKKDTAKEYEKFLRVKETLYYASGCNLVVEKKFQDESIGILDKYTDKADKEVNASGKKTETIYIVIAGATLLIGATIILLNRKK